MSRAYPCRLWAWDVCSVDGLPVSFIRVYPRAARDSLASRHELQHKATIESVDWWSCFFLFFSKEEYSCMNYIVLARNGGACGSRCCDS